jgi:hypothetical protein
MTLNTGYEAISFNLVILLIKPIDGYEKKRKYMGVDSTAVSSNEHLSNKEA